MEQTPPEVAGKLDKYARGAPTYLDHLSPPHLPISPAAPTTTQRASPANRTTSRKKKATTYGPRTVLHDGPAPS